MPSDKTLEVRPGSLDATSMRYHELWLQRWLYSRFFVSEGYPIPVVFGTPMDAFAHFKNLWADDQNPFRYLLELKDESGTPLYEPHPSPVRYPLISVMRKGQKMRPYQNFSLHRWRHVNWPTVSDAGSQVPGKDQVAWDLTKCDLGNVMVSRMPMAWDFRFQIDHFCLRPDTQAFFLERLINQFWRGGGAVPQTWMDIEYPGYGSHYIRIYVDGEIDQSAPEDSQFAETNVEYRTSFTMVIEGFDVDVNFQVYPALWKYVLKTADQDTLARLLDPITQDLRTKGSNPVLESRPDIPSAGTCQEAGNRDQFILAGTVFIALGDLSGTNPGDNVYDPNHDTPGYATDPIFINPTFSYGIASGLVFGTPVFTSGTQTPVWVSGHVSPVQSGIGIEFPAVGTLVTDMAGSYAGLLPFNYSGTAVPHYALASSFAPPVRVYASVLSDTPNQDYNWSPLHPAILASAGTDSASLGVDFGNIPIYSLANIINSQTLATTAIGTHALVVVPAAGGTDTGATLASSAFGTHNVVSVLVDTGTDISQVVSSTFGTHLQVAFVCGAGTDSGNPFDVSSFGTATLVVGNAGTWQDHQLTTSTSAFGSYTAS